MNSHRIVCPPRKADDIIVRILRKEGSPHGDFKISHDE